MECVATKERTKHKSVRYLVYLTLHLMANPSHTMLMYIRKLSSPKRMIQIPCITLNKVTTTQSKPSLTLTQAVVLHSTSRVVHQSLFT